MAFIENIKQKYLQYTLKDVENSRNEFNKKLEEVRKECDHHFDNNKKKIDTLNKKLQELQTRYTNETEALSKMESELKEATAVGKGMELEINEMKKCIQDLERKIEKEKLSKLNANDQHQLYFGQARFDLYKHLTGFHWDYSVDFKKSAKGYITNKVDYVHAVSYNYEDDRDVESSLWKEMELTVENLDKEN